MEDEVRLGDALVKALTDQLYTVDLLREGEAGWEQVQIIDYDLVLLDVTLPRLDGVSFCRRLRSHGYQLPVLTIAARDTSNDKVRGLDSGADDYVVKLI